jgi:hypothetical protein
MDMKPKSTHGAPPGSNRGGGRKKSKDALKPWAGLIYERQHPASNAKVRAALEIIDPVVNALGNPHFSSAEVFEALKEVPMNGSLQALLNIIPDLERVGKENY